MSKRRNISVASESEPSKLSNLTYNTSDENKIVPLSINTDWFQEAPFDQNLPDDRSYQIYAQAMHNNLMIDVSEYYTYQDFFSHLLFYIYQTRHNCIEKLQDIRNNLVNSFKDFSRNHIVESQINKRQKIDSQHIIKALLNPVSVVKKTNFAELDNLVKEIINLATERFSIPETCEFNKPGPEYYSKALDRELYTVPFKNPMICSFDVTKTGNNKNVKNTVVWRKLKNARVFLQRLNKNIKYMDDELLNHTWPAVDISITTQHKEMFVYTDKPNIDDEFTTSYTMLSSVNLFLKNNNNSDQPELQQRAYANTLIHFNYNADTIHEFEKFKQSTLDVFV